MNLTPTYSVVIPVYNGATSIAELIERIVKVFQVQIQDTFEIILVDDFSSDSSWNVINGLKKVHSDSVIGVRLGKNFGQHNATMCGLEKAKGKFVLTLDDDLEMKPEDFPLLIDSQKEKGDDLVYGVTNKGRKGSRGALTWLYKLISKYEGPTKAKGSSFRLISRNLVNATLKNNHHFVFLDEIFLWNTHKVNWVEVEFEKSIRGSRYRLSDLVGLTGNVILFTSTFPLKVIKMFGFLCSLISFIIGVYFILRKVFGNVEPGFTGLIVTILFSTGLIMMALAIIGEYLSKIYKGQYHQPNYYIDQEV